MTPSSALSPSLFVPPPSAREKAQARQKEKLKESKAAIETLKQIDIKHSAAEAQKAAALAKVARIKEQIQALRMTASVDPEGTARLAARLARELGQAVRAYASAGGSSADIGGGSSAAPVAQATTAPTESAPVEAAAPVETVAASATIPTAVVATVSAKPATPATGEASQQNDDGARWADDASGTDKDARRDPYRQAIEANQQRVTDMALKAGEARANAEFVAEVKRLASELKSLIRQAARALETKDDPGGEAVADDAEAAVRSLEREIDGAVQAQGGGVTILV